MRLRLLDIREDEWKAAGPALALAALAGGALALSTLASDAIFVSTFEVGRLPGFYVLTAAARVGALVVYGMRAGQRAWAATGLFVVTAVLALVSGILAPFAPEPILYLDCIALQAVPMLLPLAVASTALGRLRARQAERLLPLVAVSATLGAIVASAAARMLAVAATTSALLSLAAAFSTAAAVLPSRLAAPSTPAPVPAAPDGSGLLSTVLDGARSFGEVPIVRIVLTNAFFVAATASLVDFGFKAALKDKYGRDEMAGFLGGFGMLSGVLVLAAQLAFAGKLVSRFGIRPALAARPAAVLLLSPLAVFSAVGAAATVKLGETVLGTALADPAADLLLLPASPEVRARRAFLAGSVAQPLGVLAAALVLIPFGSVGPPRPFLALMLAIAAAGSVAALLRVHAVYTGALAEALGQGKVSLDVSPGAADLSRTELAAVLATSVEAADERKATRLLALMSDGFFALPDLAPALAAGGAIRKAAVQAAGRVARRDEGPALLAMVPPGEDDEVERDVLAVARALGAPADRPRLERAYARAKDRWDAAGAALWAEALTGLARFEPDAAMRDLQAAAQGPDALRREAALRALGELGRPPAP